MNRLKKYCSLIIILLYWVSAQSQVIDTVCPGEKNAKYSVDYHPGANYQWVVNGGSIASGQGSNAISINWGTSPGFFNVFVQEWNNLNCMAEPSEALVWVSDHKPKLSFPQKACKNDSIILKVDGSSQLIWNDATTNNPKEIKIIYDTSGWVIANDSQCGLKADTLFYQIRLGSSPIAMFSPDSGVYIKDETLMIKYLGDKSDKLNWEIKRLNVFNKNDHSFLLFLSDTGRTEIKLFAISKDGCLDSNTKWLNINEEHFYIPNAFTPNNDGLNDIFKPVCNQMSAFTLYIYSRWGQIIFESNNTEEGWNGLINGIPAPADSYIFTAQARGYSGKEYYKKGSVDLLR